VSHYHWLRLIRVLEKLTNIDIFGIICLPKTITPLCAKVGFACRAPGNRV
jgi:hypothetical protein